MSGKRIYRSVVEEINYECAYCTLLCDYKGIAYSKWGEVDLWECSVHGRFEMMSGPLEVKGEQIR